MKKRQPLSSLGIPMLNVRIRAHPTTNRVTINEIVNLLGGNKLASPVLSCGVLITMQILAYMKRSRLGHIQISYLQWLPKSCP